MADSNKRKSRPGERGDARDGTGVKRSKGGSGGKWQTPHQKEKRASRGSGKIELGDQGIWATCARNQEGRATEELKAMFEECAERFYGLTSGSDDQDDDKDVEDIESAIQKEVASMGKEKRETALFSPVRLDLQCVLFFKTRAPIDPVDFVHRICSEIVSTAGIRRMRYVNRLTPVSLIGKATEKGVEEVTRSVLTGHFNLSTAKVEGGPIVEEETAHSADIENCSYAIRPTTRQHKTLKRDAIIKQIADSVANTHKVDLTAPQKIILVEIFQTVCGMSVVGNDWDTLKRFNLDQLYPHNHPPKSTSQAKPEGATKDETVHSAESPLGKVPL